MNKGYAGIALAGGLAALAVSWAAGAVEPTVGQARPADLFLRDAWDKTTELRSLDGQPLLLVYEDKDSAQQNDVLKRELGRLAAGDAYRGRVALVAVADVSQYDYWPARTFVKSAIRGESKKAGTPIYCDWNGTIRTAFNLRRGASNVVLYDRAGRAAFAWSGPMPADKRHELIERLRTELTAPR